jgi:hypothetical protein
MSVKTRHIDKNSALAKKVLIFPVSDAQLGIELGALLNGNILVKAPTLAIGTDKTKIAHGEYIIQVDGFRTRIAAGEVAFTATTHDVADPDASGREITYLLSMTTGGSTPTITAGTIAALGASAAPATPAGHVVLGTVKVAHDGTAIFDATTDELDEAHLTDTYTPATAYGETALTDVPVGSFLPGYEFIVEEVQHYFHDITAAFSYDVEIDGTTVLASAGSPADATRATKSLTTTFVNRIGSASAVLTVDITKDAAGAGRGGYIAVTIRPYRMHGDPSAVLTG